MAIESWKRLNAGDRRAQLLALGHDLFNSRRYTEISVDDIAQAAGVSKGLLYHYFPSKEEFFLAGVERGCEQLLKATEASRGPNGEPSLVAALRGYLDYVEHNSQGYVNLFRGETATLPGIKRACERTRKAIAERMLARLGVPSAPMTCTRAAIRGYQGFVEALVLHWLEERRLERRQVEALILPAVFNALLSGAELDLADSASRLAEVRARLEAERRQGLETLALDSPPLPG